LLFFCLLMRVIASLLYWFKGTSVSVCVSESKMSVDIDLDVLEI
jgi:hypothetical protein